jgi:hypothetical protein
LLLLLEAASCRDYYISAGVAAAGVLQRLIFSQLEEAGSSLDSGA